jgi:hypothetical protein
MGDLFWKIHEIMNNIKGFTVGYSIQDEKMLFEFNGKRYVAEFREIEYPKDDIRDDMRRIKYL